MCILVHSSFEPLSAIVPYRCTCNAFFMDLSRPSFVCPIHLCSPQKVSFARDGFHLLWKSSVVATLITKVQLLIRTAE